MIKNEKEYLTTRKALSGYEDALSKFDILQLIRSGVDPVIARAQRNSYERQAKDLRDQLEAYEALKSGNTNNICLEEISDLGKSLVEARLARGLTQRELANIAGIQEQQIQRYEKESYETASLKRISHIANAIGIEFSARLLINRTNEPETSQLPTGLSLADFPFADMNAKGWFGTRINLRKVSPAERVKVLEGFFGQAPQEIGLALHRKTNSEISPARRAALLSWQARVLTRARQKAALARRFEALPADVISQLPKLSTDKDGIRKAVEMLLGYGVILIFEPHLPKTKIDGAAMSLDKKYAVIGMSIRFDRIDNFWFVLMHELGHIALHWPKVLYTAIIDENAGEGDDDTLEKEADEFAENAIMPKEKWQSSLIRFTKSAQTIEDFANRHNLHPALIAGRIRRDRGYTDFSDMLGSGEIRANLQAAGLWE